MIDSSFSPYKHPHDYGAPRDIRNTNLDSWRYNNDALLRNGNSERQRADRLVEDSLRLCQNRYEINKLCEKQVKQKLENRVDSIGVWEDELEGMLNDLKREDDKLQLCHARLCESIEKNLRPIWDMANKCLQLRLTRAPIEATEDEVNHLLRDEMKLSERTSRYFDHIISNLENQHRLNNTINHRCKTLKLLERESREAARIADELMRADGLHPHQRKDVTIQMHPVKMNFMQWSNLCEDATRAALREINKSNVLRLAGDDAIAIANESFEKLYGEIDKAFERRVTDVRKAKNKLLDEHRRVLEDVQKVRAVKDDLDNLLNTLITPERIAQYEVSRRALVTDLYKQTDIVHNALHREVEEYRHGNRKAADQLEQCEKQMISLRGLINQLIIDIQQKDEAISIDEVQCRQLRNTIKLKKIEPSKTGNPMQGDVVALFDDNKIPV